MSGGGNGYDANALGGQFGNKLSSYLNSPAPTFGQSLFVEPSSTTTTALSGISSAASNPTYAKAAGQSLQSVGDIAAGKSLGYQDPYFQANLDKTLSDTRGDVMSSLGASGNLNSDLQINELTKALGNVRDTAYNNERYYQDSRQANAVTSLLPAAYQNTLAPGTTMLGAGQTLDQINTARRAGEADLQNRTQNADYQRFLELLGAFTGSQNNAGMQEQPNPLQMLLGAGLTGASLFL